MDLRTLREAIEDWARSGVNDQSTDRDDLKRALETRDIYLTDDLLDIALATIRKRTFMGGNYTLDAKAVRIAIENGTVPR